MHEERDGHLGAGEQSVQRLRETLLFDNRVMVLIRVLNGRVVVVHHLELFQLMTQPAHHKHLARLPSHLSQHILHRLHYPSRRCPTPELPLIYLSN